MKRRGPVLISILALTSLMSLTAFGQVSSSISGVVHDPNGEVISGATVIVQDNFNKAADGFYSRVDARLDAIEEVTISTATPGAESSAQGAIQIKYVTRQGSNQFHGSVYEYHRNPSLNANYWFNNRDQAPVHKETGLICGTPQQPFDGEKRKAPRDRILFNQFGFRVGGPIILPKRLFGPLGFDGQNKAFFFVNYEEFRFPSQVSRQRTILSPDAQKGIFRYGSRQVDLLALAAKSDCDPGPATVPCTSTIDPTVGKLLADIRNSTTGKGGIQQLTDPNLQRFTFANPSGDCAPQNVNVYGPMFTRFDLSAVKRIKIKEGVNFELRGEFLNAFNNVNFFNPSGNAFTSPTSQTLHAGDGSLSGLVQHQRSGRPAGADSRPDQLLTSTFNVLGEALFGTALPQFLISVQT